MPRFTTPLRALTLATLSAATLALAAPAVGQQDVLAMSNEEQKDWLTNFVQDRLSTPERQIRLSNIDGILGSNVSVREITISDADGVWLRVNNASLNWNQAALFLGRLEVNSLTADSIEYFRNPVPSDQPNLPAPEAGSFQIPEFPVAIILNELSVPTVTFGENVFGLGSEISLAGALQLESGNLDASLDIVRLDGPGGTLDLDLDYLAETNVLDLGFVLEEPENGVIANLLNIEGRPAVSLTLTGSGPVSDLQADLTLAANGQTALAGTTTISQVAEGYTVDADLRGPLSTLIAEPYRPFFGAETALTADALVRSEGGFTVDAFRLSGGQLSVSGSAATTADNFLTRLDLDAVIADPSGAAVTLPVPGAATRIGSAQLSIDYGTEAGDTWSATLAASGFESTDFAADTLRFDLGGVAANLSDPATRRLTFNGDGALSGIAASPEVEAALGDSIGLGIAGLWNAGEPVQLAELRIAGANLTAALTGQLDGFDFKGDIGLETSSISPFSGLAGRDLDGALSLDATGLIQPLSGGFDLVLDGTGTGLSIDDAVADRLLEGTVELSGRIARTETGLEADAFRLGNQQLQLTADGTYASAVADFGFTLDLADLALVTDAASGAVRVIGTARGEEGIVDLSLVGTIAEGQLVDRALRDATLRFDGSTTDAGLTGTISGEAALDGYRTLLSASLAADSDALALSQIDFQAAGTRVTGAVTRTAATGLLDGSLSLVSPDVSIPAALLLLDAEGAINADVTLAATDDRQSATVRADVSSLRLDAIRIGSADVSATVADLFGVPAIDGSASATDVVAGGVTVETLTARASQTGGATSFDAQARLATGTDLDVAGSLAPVENGFRLALERADLDQGSLSARLAQPATLEVIGESVQLDAIRFDVGSSSITATGTAGSTLDITADIQSLPLSVANAFAPDLALSGTLSGRASISGASSDPQVRFEASASGVNAAALSDLGVNNVSATANGTYAGGTVQLAALSAQGGGGLSLSGSGSVPLSGGGLDLRLTGSAPLALGNRWLADRGGQLSGVLDLDARVGGSLTSPTFGGTVSTTGAGYVDPELNLRLVGVSGSATLDGTNLVIQRLSGSSATGGTVSASGSIGLSGGFPANLTLALRNARYADGNLFVATLSGDLALTGNLAGNPLLSGDVLVERADITVPNSFGGGTQLIDVDHRNTPRPVAITLDRARIDTAPGAPVPQTRPAGLLLDVTLNAPNQVFIRGRGLDAEAGGSVRLTGPVNNIQPVGGFSLIRGRLSVLGQRITFESGTVTLVGDLDPFLNLVARTEGDGITVFVTVSGRVSEVDVSFTSNPPLPQDEVLSRLIFNRSLDELSPLQLVRLAAAAGELVGGGGGGLVDGLRGAAGLADLDVVTDDQGNLAVQAGTYIQDNVYLGVTAGANGQSRVNINLDVTNDLTVRGSAGQDGDTSLGVFYERDY
ncbi:translocation/assembly module TamB domain-containing protein [Devosia albogilva]|uniref:Translocation/assembly module TamB domain-containing protein n=1 Tax=Devosia albogilva TaxID=429726 RepID=A0ABW5QI35_9HYPH